MEGIKIMKKKLLFLGGGVALAGGSVMAAAPIDMGAVSGEIAGYITTAAGFGLVIFGGLYAIRVIIKAFRSASH